MPYISKHERARGAWSAAGLNLPDLPAAAPRWGQPCTHVAGTTVCGATPTRLYLKGRRCVDHTPAALAGRPENRPDPDRTAVALQSRARETNHNQGDRYGPPGTKYTPQYDSNGRHTGREAGAAARAAERRAAKDARDAA